MKFYKRVRKFFRQEYIRSATRMFVLSFAILFIPATFGFLNGITEWAASEGQRPFPEVTSLAYVGVQALVSATLAVGNVLWRFIENLSGKGFLREVPPGPPPGQ